MKEEWKPLRGYETSIEISNFGKVRRIIDLPKKPAPFYYKSKIGIMNISQSYISDGITRSMVLIAKEVLVAFGGAKRPYLITYKDGDNTNCRIDNLEYKEKGNGLNVKEEETRPKEAKYLHPERDCTQCKSYPCFLDRNNQKFNHKTHFAKSGCVNYKKL